MAHRTSEATMFWNHGAAGSRCAVAYVGAGSVCCRRFPAAHHRLRLVIGARRIGASGLCRGTISTAKTPVVCCDGPTDTEECPLLTGLRSAA